MPLKVIGTGLGRTDTRLLKTALEELGFGKCYHMEEVMKNPRHLQRWADVMHGGNQIEKACSRGSNLQQIGLWQPTTRN